MGHDFCPQYLLVSSIRYVVRQRPGRGIVQPLEEVSG